MKYWKKTKQLTYQYKLSFHNLHHQDLAFDKVRHTCCRQYKSHLQTMNYQFQKKYGFHNFQHCQSNEITARCQTDTWWHHYHRYKFFHPNQFQPNTVCLCRYHLYLLSETNNAWNSSQFQKFIVSFHEKKKLFKNVFLVIDFNLRFSYRRFFVWNYLKHFFFILEKYRDT